MFIRSVWRNRRLRERCPGFREPDPYVRRESDPLGRAGSDFTRMTQGLFDR